MSEQTLVPDDLVTITIIEHDRLHRALAERAERIAALEAALRHLVPDDSTAKTYDEARALLAETVAGTVTWTEEQIAQVKASPQEPADD